MKWISINDLYIQACSGFRDPSSSPNVTSRLKVPVISHTLEMSLLHHYGHHLSPKPIDLNVCQLSTYLTIFESLFANESWSLQQRDNILLLLLFRESNENSLSPFLLRPNSTSVVSPPFCMNVIKDLKMQFHKEEAKVWNLHLTWRSAQTDRQKWMWEHETGAESSTSASVSRLANSGQGLSFCD